VYLLSLAQLSVRLLASCQDGSIGVTNGPYDKRERLEKIVDLISASFGIISGCRSIEDLRRAQPPPEARQATMLAHLYFPDLVPPTQEYLNALIRYYHFAVDCYNSAVPATVGA
jgi:hypothetical protein